MKYFSVSLALFISVTVSAYGQFGPDIKGMPDPGTPPRWNPQTVHEDVLPNGIRVLYTKVNDIPKIDVDLIFHAGAGNEPVDKSGVANLTAELIMGGGAKDMSIGDISSELSRYGTITSEEVGYNNVRYSFSCLKEYFPQSFSLFVKLLSNPRFDTTVFKQKKEQTINSVIKRIDNPADMTTRTLLKAMFGDEVPYAYSPQGRFRDLYTMKIEDCEAYYADQYTPDNLTLVIAGDMEYSSLKSLLIDRTLAWEKSSNTAPVSTEFKATAVEPQIIVIDDTQVAQAMFRIGFACTSRDSDDFETLLMMNEVFGADRSSRLGRAMMGERVLTPYIVSGLSFQRELGYFVISGSIPARYVDTAFSVIFETIDAMIAKPASVEEMYEARKMFVDNFDLEFTTNQKVRTKIEEIVSFGLPRNHYQNYLKRFNDVTVERMQAATNVLFHSPWVAVITGDATAIQPALKERYGIPVKVIFPDDVIAQDRPAEFEAKEEEGLAK